MHQVIPSYLISCLLKNYQKEQRRLVNAVYVFLFLPHDIKKLFCPHIHVVTRQTLLIAKPNQTKSLTLELHFENQ